MTETLISLETAKLAKEKGFDWPVRFCYDKCEMLATYVPGGNRNYNNSGYCCNAPEQSTLQKWLRDIHGWHILVIPVVTMGYTFKIMKVWKKDFDPNKELEIETPPYSGVDAYDYGTYEEALEVGLLESLKLV